MIGSGWLRARWLGAALALAGAMTSPAAAQLRPIDPDSAIDGDLAGSSAGARTTTHAEQRTAPLAAAAGSADSPGVDPAPSPRTTDETGTSALPTPPAGAATYRKDDLIGAAEGIFGKGAQGLAGIIEDLLRKQGEPNGYITGREGGGAMVVGLRYGSGTLFHKVEGEMPVYWTGPSIGFDAGANAARTFVLVYNLYDSADLYRRYPAGEGQAYFIGGFHISYLRRGDVVLIPVRAGAGLRLGVNAGYMKFSRKQRWLPF